MNQPTNKKVRPLLPLLILAFGVLFLAAPSWARIFFVDPSGSDTPNCTDASSPCRSITFAVAQANSGTAVSPDIINVAPGTYSAAATGETFPINLDYAYVTLQRSGSSAAIIDVLNTATDALYVTATGVIIDGLTFRNAGNAIYSTAGGLTVINSFFENSVTDGVSFFFSETDYASDYTLEDMLISNNTFYVTRDGVYFDLDLDFDAATPVMVSLGSLTISTNEFQDNIDSMDVSNYSISDIYNGMVTIGDIILSDNIISDQSDKGIKLSLFNFEYLSGNTVVTIGNVTIDNNNITSNYANTGAEGIDIEPVWYFGYLADDTRVTVGNLGITNNRINVYDEGIYVYFDKIEYLGDQASSDAVRVITGTFTVDNNRVTSKISFGIYVEIEDSMPQYVYADSMVTIGSTFIRDNLISSEEEGIYFELTYGSYLYDSAKLTVGTFTATGNTVTSISDYGIYLYYYGAAYETYNNSNVAIGSMTISTNTVTSYDESLYIEYEYPGSKMNNNSSLQMDTVTVADNSFFSSNDHAMELYFDDDSGYDLHDNAVASLPSHEIINNSFDTAAGSGYYGLYIYFYDWPYSNYDSSRVTLGPMRIADNSFNPDKNPGMDTGIYIYYDDTGYDIYNKSQVHIGDLAIDNNTFYRMNAYAVYLSFYYFGWNLDDQSSLTMGSIDISKNKAFDTPNGLYFYLENENPDNEAALQIGDINIVDNMFDGIRYYGVELYSYLYNSSSPDAMVSVGTTTIKGNSINGKPGGTDPTSAGIYLYADYDPRVTFPPSALTGNTIEGLATGIYLYGLEEAELSCNVLRDNSKYGLSLESNGSFTTSYNIFEGNVQYALYIPDGNTASVKAEQNWWGDPAGPSACASCNRIYFGGGTVDYTPWLTRQPSRSLCGDFPWILFMPAIIASNQNS